MNIEEVKECGVYDERHDNIGGVEDDSLEETEIRLSEYSVTDNDEKVSVKKMNLMNPLVWITVCVTYLIMMKIL